MYARERMVSLRVDSGVCLQVINVMKRWLNQHFYDFENQPLLDTLIAFIDSVVGTSLCLDFLLAAVYIPEKHILSMSMNHISSLCTFGCCFSFAWFLVELTALVSELWNAKWANALRLNIQEKNSTSLLSALHAKSSLELIVAAMKKVTCTLFCSLYRQHCG